MKKIFLLILISLQYLMSFSQCTFKNPLAAPNFPDPWIIYYNGWYYWCKQDFGSQITVEKATNIPGAGVSTTGWTKVASCDNSGGLNLGTNNILSNVWAPELHLLNGKWYIYSSGSDNASSISNLRIFVLESTNGPFGPYTFKAFLNTSGGWAIDPDVIVLPNGQMYVSWSNFDNAGQCIHIGNLTNPWTIGSQTTISSPTNSWETHFGNVNEGPEFLIRNNKIMIIYSASQCHTSYYCLGQLTAGLTSNLVNASSWTKTGPVFKSGTCAYSYGPGHCCFVKSPDQKEDWIVYHAHKSDWTTDASDHGDRAMCTQKFTWNGDNPNFGTCLGNCTTQSCPSISTIGISNYTDDPSLIIYPNPATNQVVIKNENYKINSVTIFSIEGRVVYQSNEEFLGNKIIDVHSIKSGIYLINLKSKDMNLIRKIIIL